MLLTKEQIIEYLVSSNFTENYVCGDGTTCEMFLRRVIPDKVFGQTSMGLNMPARHWWIEYKSDENKFVLNCSYFDLNGNPISRDEFIVLLKTKLTEEQINNIPAVMYTPTAVIEWLPTNTGEWTATYSVVTRTSGCMISGPLSKILHKSAAPTITPTPTNTVPSITPTPSRLFLG